MISGLFYQEIIQKNTVKITIKLKPDINTPGTPVSKVYLFVSVN